MTGSRVQRDEVLSASLTVHAPPMSDDVQTARPLAFHCDDEEAKRLAAMGMAAAGVVHDLGNLLQVVASAVRLLDRDLGPAHGKLRSFLDGARLSSDRATALCRQVLDQGKPPATDGDVVHLDVMLIEFAPLIGLAAGADISINLEIGSDIPAIACHRGELENAILNLVINARDAMDGKGRLILSVDRFIDVLAAAISRSAVVLRIADTGCGMSEDVSSKAFQPFFTTKEAGRGSGLGLATVNDFVRRMGGSISVDSDVGKGTIISLLLPSCGG